MNIKNRIFKMMKQKGWDFLDIKAYISVFGDDILLSKYQQRERVMAYLEKRKLRNEMKLTNTKKKVNKL